MSLQVEKEKEKEKNYSVSQLSSSPFTVSFSLYNNNK